MREVLLFFDLARSRSGLMIVLALRALVSGE
jgi:hypothetical protein